MLYGHFQLNLNKNVIKSIHDQGAGGMANVTKEMISPMQKVVKFFLKNVDLGDNTLSDLEIWGARHQEQMTMLINENDKNYVNEVCKRENVPLSIVGNVEETKKIEVFNSKDDLIVDLNLLDILENIPQKEYNFTRKPLILNKLNIPGDLFINHIKKFFLVFLYHLKIFD